MATTTFSGPVVSTNGFTTAAFLKLTAITTSELPAAAAGNAGQVRLISDNGAGNNEYCLVVSTGSAWVTAVGAALS
jgi:microcompartment protein CcmK/EutM